MNDRARRVDRHWNDLWVYHGKGEWTGFTPNSLIFDPEHESTTIPSAVQPMTECASRSDGHPTTPAAKSMGTKR